MKLTQDIYWQNLGIARWKLRSLSESIPRVELLLDKQNKQLAILVADPNSVQEDELLGKIVNALGLHAESISPEQFASCSHLAYLVFGGHLQKNLAHVNVKESLVLCSLQSMLNEPSLKREVWQKLQKFKSL